MLRMAVRTVHFRHFLRKNEAPCVSPSADLHLRER